MVLFYLSLDIIYFIAYLYVISIIHHLNCLWRIIWLGCTDIAESQLRNRTRLPLRLRKEKKILKKVNTPVDKYNTFMIEYICKREKGILPTKKELIKEKGENKMEMKIGNFTVVDTEYIDEAMRERLTEFADIMFINKVANENCENTTDKNLIYEVTRKFNDSQLDAICSYVWGTHSAIHVCDVEKGIAYSFVNDEFSKEGKDDIFIALKDGDAFNVKFKNK